MKELTGYASKDKPWTKYYSEKSLNLEMPKKTLYGFIKEKNKNNLDKVAIQYFNTNITYKELFDNIDKCAYNLSKLGVKKGDIVTISMLTTPELIYIFYALNKLGAVANMIDPRKSEIEFKKFIDDAHSNLIIGLDNFVSKYKKLNVDKIIQLSIGESFSPIKKKLLSLRTKKVYITWDELMSDSADVEEVEYEENLPALIVYTGGTTGVSKGVVLTNDNINASVVQCKNAGIGFEEEGRYLQAMPLFIAYGVTNSLHLALSSGYTLVIILNYKPELFDKILLKYKPNYMCGVPFHYISLLKSKKMKNKDLSFVKVPIVGGDQLSPSAEIEVNKFLKEHNCNTEIVKGYGMTEVCAAATVSMNDKVNVPETVGIPLPKTIVSIHDFNTGEELKYGEIGEIRISGPNLMYGYYNNEEENKKVIKYESNTKIVCTGDCGKMDEDGHLFLVDRYKNIIIRCDGFKVFPSEIEKVIESVEHVVQCEVVGYYNDAKKTGKNAYAFIKVDDEVDKTKILKEIKKECKKHLAEYSLPYKYIFVDEFPKTSIGKTDIEKLKEMIKER